MKSAPQRRIGGAITALVTPFRDGELDAVDLMAHIEWQLASGIDGLLACSLTGEGPVLTEQERARVIEICVALAEGRVPVVIATGTNDTATTIEETRQAQKLGADAALVTVPYYSKPTQKGILHHFERLAESVDLPLIIHNLPSHTAADLSPSTAAGLAELPTVIGIADGSGDLSRFSSWRRLLPERIGFYSTQDATALASTIAGGRGTFSSTANILPRLFHSMQQAAGCDHLAAARLIDDRMRPLFGAIARESEPATVKHALALMRGMSPEVRLPLTGVEDATSAAIAAATELFQADPHARVKAPHAFSLGL